MHRDTACCEAVVCSMNGMGKTGRGGGAKSCTVWPSHNNENTRQRGHSADKQGRASACPPTSRGISSRPARTRKWRERVSWLSQCLGARWPGVTASECTCQPTNTFTIDSEHLTRYDIVKGLTSNSSFANTLGSSRGSFCGLRYSGMTGRGTCRG